MTIHEISVQELDTLRKNNEDYFLLDVRNPNEYEICNLGGYLIPINELPARLNELPARLNELDQDKYIIVHCRSGGRSSRVVEFLQQQGFARVSNLRGGITAWANEIDLSMSKY